MASTRATYRHGQGGTFVWVSLRDPGAEELASVQREFGLPAPLVDALGVAASWTGTSVTRWCWW